MSTSALVSIENAEIRARRAYILNFLLLGSLGLLGFLSLASISAYINHLSKGIPVQATPASPIIAFLLFLTLYLFSRRGFTQAVAILFIIFFLLGGLIGMLTWGIDLPEGILIIFLAVVASGILIRGRFTQILCSITVLLLIGIGVAQDLGILHPDRSWRIAKVDMTDSLIAAGTLMVILLIAWLYNRELENSLRRAVISERALKVERDQLEITVEKRTQALQQSQYNQMVQLRRFADLGRQASSLVHDLLNPVSAQLLNLQYIQQHPHDWEKAVQRAVGATEEMERQIKGAREQLRHEETLSHFDAAEAVQQAIKGLHRKANQAKIRFDFQLQSGLILNTNPVKFAKVIQNLVSNSIDASPPDSVITITLKKSWQGISLTVQDFGSGIAPDVLPHIFEPFYSTKSKEGIGIGLVICQDIVEKEWGGHLRVNSKVGVGTTVSVQLPKQLEG